jgi:hypothetical protein
MSHGIGKTESLLPCREGFWSVELVITSVVDLMSLNEAN